MKKNITLTQQEIDEIKDDIKFREKVILQLKQLNGIPKEVWTLKVWAKIQWFFVASIMTGLITLGFKVLMK